MSIRAALLLTVLAFEPSVFGQKSVPFEGSPTTPREPQCTSRVGRRVTIDSASLLCVVAAAGSTPVRQSDPFSGLPITPRVLFTIDGARHDHLGCGVLGLHDVDGDGVSDLLLGAINGVPGLSQGRGYALVCSGKDGSVVWRIEGMPDPEGDSFGESPLRIGDVDDDGVEDFAIHGFPAPWAVDAHPEYVNAYSGATGKTLRTWTGESWNGSRIGAWAALGVGDLDGDGVPEVLVNGLEQSCAYSGCSTGPNWCAEGAPMGSTRDLDGDCLRDVLLVSGDFRRPIPCRWIVSGFDGRVLSQVDLPAIRATLRFVCAVGDLDLDGVPDVLLVNGLGPKKRVGRNDSYVDVSFECLLVSGSDGSVLCDWFEEQTADVQVLDANSLDDLDGDGVGEIFVAVWNRLRIYSGKTRARLLELNSTSSSFGFKVRTVGDLDGDGVPELVVTDNECGTCAGRAWVLSTGRLGAGRRVADSNGSGSTRAQPVVR